MGTVIILAVVQTKHMQTLLEKLKDSFEMTHSNEFRRLNEALLCNKSSLYFTTLFMRRHGFNVL